jgi:hypothetical protein
MGDACLCKRAHWNEIVGVSLSQMHPPAGSTSRANTAEITSDRGGDRGSGMETIVEPCEQP